MSSSMRFLGDESLADFWDVNLSYRDGQYLFSTAGMSFFIGGFDVFQAEMSIELRRG